MKFPFIMQLDAMDCGPSCLRMNFIQLVLIAQLVLVISRMLIEVIRRTILLHISTRVNVSLIYHSFGYRCAGRSYYAGYHAFYTIYYWTDAGTD